MLITAISGLNLTVLRGYNGTVPAAHSDDATVNIAAPNVNPNVTFEQTVNSKAGSYYGLDGQRSGRNLVRGNVGHTAANRRWAT